MSLDLGTPRHLCRKAVIYVRQSTPHQVLTNQESLRLQSALRQRATDLGWNKADVEVIDADLGLSGGCAPPSGVRSVGKLPAGVIVQRLAVAGHLHTAVVIADLR
jgi:hypothetical protein